jgi:hypothetical protein
MLYRCGNGHEIHLKRKPSAVVKWIHYGQFILENRCTECDSKLKEVVNDSNSKTVPRLD